MLLPNRFNDGKPVPRSWFGEAAREVTSFFWASSLETQIIKGLWVHEGIEYRDDLRRLAVDVVDNAKNRKWLRAFKARWKERTQQLQIWMISWRINIE